MSGTGERLAALERRLNAAEDELAIIRLVASYGPLVDCGNTQLAPSLFTLEGVYDVSYSRIVGHGPFSEMLQGEQHQQFVKDGNKTVADVLKETDKDLKITRFVRINLG